GTGDWSRQGSSPGAQACLRKSGAGPVTERPGLQDRMVGPVSPARHALAGCFKIRVPQVGQFSSSELATAIVRQPLEAELRSASLLIFVCTLAVISASHVRRLGRVGPGS